MLRLTMSGFVCLVALSAGACGDDSGTPAMAMTAGAGASSQFDLIKPPPSAAGASAPSAAGASAPSATGAGGASGSPGTVVADMSNAAGSGMTMTNMQQTTTTSSVGTQGVPGETCVANGETYRPIKYNNAECNSCQTLNCCAAWVDAQEDVTSECFLKCL